MALFDMFPTQGTFGEMEQPTSVFAYSQPHVTRADVYAHGVGGQRSGAATPAEAFAHDVRPSADVQRPLFADTPFEERAPPPDAARGAVPMQIEEARSQPTVVRQRHRDPVRRLKAAMQNNIYDQTKDITAP